MTLGQRIKQRRTEIGLSKIMLAAMIKVNVKTLTRYENDMPNRMDSDTLILLTKSLQTTADYLLGNEAETDKSTAIVNAYMKSIPKDATEEEHKNFINLLALVVDVLLQSPENTGDTAEQMRYIEEYAPKGIQDMAGKQISITGIYEIVRTAVGYGIFAGNKKHSEVGHDG